MTARLRRRLVMGTLKGFPTPAMGSGGQSPPSTHAIWIVPVVLAASWITFRVLAAPPPGQATVSDTRADIVAR